MKRNKRWLYVYLNNEVNYADSLYTAWPFNRALSYFKKKFNDWHTIEVRSGEVESGSIYAKETRRQEFFPNAKSHEVKADYVPQRCGSGWTGDRCTLPLHHEGPHSN